MNSAFAKGQEGTFQLLDAAGRPLTRVTGEILSLYGRRCLYAFIRTDSGFVSGRLA